MPVVPPPVFARARAYQSTASGSLIGCAGKPSRQAVAAGVPEADLPAAMEAAHLAFALRAKARGRRPAIHITSPRVTDPPDLVAELDFQRRLARAFRGLPTASSAADC
ncbi:hypothetical protein GCM10010214_59380 [Streptomyces abikoensis]|nr:hypothetical protein GCM10010214_59380 [Streptomyces abikoensis]